MMLRRENAIEKQAREVQALEALEAGAYTRPLRSST